MNKKAFYITTTLPYVNAPLHLGHATEIIRADAIARYKRLMGHEVFFNTGTDEHGKKIAEAAEKAGKPVGEYVDVSAAAYKDTLREFGVEPTAYVRTTDVHHIRAAQEFWKRCEKAGFIYKKNYQAKYCVGCEEEKTESELVDGKCPIHNRVPELIDEENYFFKFSAFGDKLLAFYDTHPDFIVPTSRMNEMREFIKRGLRDFSISRLKSKMSWGIEVPGDAEHVMYVWFDALTNYISTLGWPEDTATFQRFWQDGTPVQYCGKDNTRFQGVMWQAMLMAADLPPTNAIVVDGFILGEGGVKMSKSLGNVIDPLEIVKEYGTEALRYFILKEFHPFEDTAVSKTSLKEWYNAGLANGIGNLTSRIMKMAVDNNVRLSDEDLRVHYYSHDTEELPWSKDFRIDIAMSEIWQKISQLDGQIQATQPFKKIKTNPEEGRRDIYNLLFHLHGIALMLEPFLPETSASIRHLLQGNSIPAKPLFLRK